MILAQFKEVNTAIPGFVETYDPDTKTAEITIPISDFTESALDIGIELDWAKVGQVPVIHTAGAGWLIHCPLENGDPVLIEFCQRSITDWFLSNGREPVSADTLQMFPEYAMIAKPRLFPDKNRMADNPVNETDLIISHRSGLVELRLTAAGEVQIKADAVRLGALDGSQAVALATETNARFAAIESFLATHVHISNGPAAPTNVAIGAPSGSSVASAKVFTNG